MVINIRLRHWKFTNVYTVSWKRRLLFSRFITDGDTALFSSIDFRKSCLPGPQTAPRVARPGHEISQSHSDEVSTMRFKNIHIMLLAPIAHHCQVKFSHMCRARFRSFKYRNYSVTGFHTFDIVSKYLEPIHIHVPM